MAETEMLGDVIRQLFDFLSLYTRSWSLAAKSKTNNENKITKNKHQTQTKFLQIDI